MIPKKKTEEKLGEILVRRGKISEGQLKQALEVQAKKGGLIGEVLRDLGFAGEREIVEAIISQYGFPFISLESFDFNKEALKLIPEETARRSVLVPLDLIGDIITIAIANPLDSRTIKELESLAKKTVCVYISTASSIEQAIAKAYKEK